MTAQRLWPAALAGGVGLLLLGRLVAEGVTNRLWAGSLGVAEPLGAIAELKAVLIALAFCAGAIWSLGNLYVLTRSIGSVQVPRRLGDLEILEQVPRRYLALAVLVLGLTIAGLLALLATEWWRPRALWDTYMPMGLQEPILGRDLGWYLFRLPWLLALQRFVLYHAGIVLAVMLVIYMLIGSLRVRARAITASDLARTHVGSLLVVFALALYWGYRLEPAEHVAGLTGVAADTVLTGVRLPVARVLAALALVAGGATVAWIWLSRTVVAVIAWILLGAASAVGHYLVPAAAAARVRPTTVVSETIAERYRALAYGLAPELVERPATPTRAEVAGTPVWDAFAVAFTLDRTLPGRPWDRFFAPHLIVHDGGPMWLAVREVDLDAARRDSPAMRWDQVHGVTYGRAEGVAAVDGVAITARGLPRYYADLGGTPADTPTLLAVTGQGFWFTPTMGDFTVAPADGEVQGIPLGGRLRRVALAWALQSPQLLSGRHGPETLVLADRAVSRRLARLAPFARFGAAYPALVRGRLTWIAAGYVWADGFPLAPEASWRGRRVRYLRMGFVGTVDAVSGASAVYVAPGADVVSRAWAALTDPLVQPAGAIPPEVLERLHYPDELFQVQVALALQAAGPGLRATEPHAVVGRGLADTTLRHRLRAALEDHHLRVLFDGYMTADGPQLDRARILDSNVVFATRPLAQSFARGAASLATIPGPLKLVASPAGVIGVQTYYADPEAPGVPPWVVEVAVGWRGWIGRGGTLDQAVGRVAAVAPERPAEVELLPTLREWFDRLDRARSAGDWEAFGVAWDRLRRLLADSVR